MFKKVYSLILFNCSWLLVTFNSFSQTEIYKSNFVFNNFNSNDLSNSMIVLDENILFNASDYNLYSIQKKDGKINWQNHTGWKTNITPFIYRNTFFYGKHENEVVKFTKYNLNTGEKVVELPIESINSKPNFVNHIMYCTALMDGGKLLAYNIEENKIIWQKNIGYGIDFQPIYLKDKIIANADDDNWFEIDYNGNFIKTKSKKHTYIDTAKIFVKKYKFLTHDNKEITQDFLNKNKLSNSDYQTKISDAHTFILNEKQLLILGDNKKKVLQLNLETEFPTDDFETDAYSAILTATADNIWFCYQNFLIHYDCKNNKRLRKVNLSKWNPHQIVIENRTIWLISKNDGQLYGLDFEPNQRSADEIEAKARMEFERNRCFPDPKMVEAKRAAEEKFKNMNLKTKTN